MLKFGDKTSQIYGYARDKKNISVFGAQKNTRRAIFTMLERAVLIEPDYVSAREAYDFVSGLTDAVFLPARSDSIGMYSQRFGENDYERMDALAKIASGAAHVVTFVEAAQQLYPNPSDVAKSVIRLQQGQELDPTALVKKLAAAGYKRLPQVEERGEFAVRGDIVDVYAVGGQNVRISFDFDVIGSIKHLTDEQLSAERLDGIEIAPAGEAYYDPGDIPVIIGGLRAEAAKLSAAAAAHFLSRLTETEMQLEAGRRDIPLVLPMCASAPFGGFMQGYTAVFADAKQCADNAALIEKEHASRIASLTAAGDALPSSVLQIVPAGKAFGTGGGSVTFHTGTSQNRLTAVDCVIELTDEMVPGFAFDYNYLELYVKNKLKSGHELFIFCGNLSSADAVSAFLKSRGIITGEASGVTVLNSFLSGSFVLGDTRQVFLGTPSVVAKTGRSERRRREIMPLPEVGDYVVHDVHGVGKCLAIQKLNLTGSERDYVIIGYEGDDKLMLPVENLDSLSKFSYSDDVRIPKLSKLGGGQFARLKEKVKASIKEMAIDLVELYGKREAGRGHVYSAEPELMDEFISAFEYVDTPDQTECTKEALNDLALGKIMDRLLCGDVGFGKTEVAMRVAYRVIAEKKQAALLCPTTILAYQHYRTVRRRMEPFGVRVGMLSRLSTAAEARDTLEKLEDGRLDIVCGTHKLLGKEVKFNDIGLLVLDEEQRFGVAHKEQIKQLKTTVNVLTMTATPIPRTLHMSLSGIRDISMLTTPPAARLPVQTFVAEYSDGLLYDALMREKSRGGQSFIVYNRVDKIDSFAAKTDKVLGGKLTIGVAHGQMNAKQSEEVIEKFAMGEIDVLIATTIIENGIDIPRANTMVVVDADKFGLSQMYQLRGRIGRSDRLASAYFTYERANRLSDTAMRRLDAIMQCRELGSGFMLAMRDLELRGAGNVLGRQQHGHMDQVGYDTYMKLLGEVMGELRGEPVRRAEEVRVRTDADAFIPADYIPDEEWRVRQYSRISRIDGVEALRKIQTDLTDMYGEPPKSVTNLLTIALVKNIAAELGASEASLTRTDGSLAFKKALAVPPELARRAEGAGGRVIIGDKAYVSLPSGKAMVKFLFNYKSYI